VVVLLFLAFQLWGTGLLEAHSQSVLRQHLAQELPRVARNLQPHTPSAGDRGVSDRPAPATAAPAEGQPVGFLQIPAIGLGQVIVEGVATGDLRMGPGHYAGTPLPGQPGNAAIAGHRTTYAHPFYNLNELVPGDRILIVTPQGIFLYRVRFVTAVAPTDTSVLAPTNRALLTLTTCNPRYSASQRLVLRAVLTRSLLFGPSGAHRAPTPRRPRSGAAVAAATDLAGDTAGGSAAPAIGWGLLLVAAGLAMWALARRTRRRWPVYLVGGVAVAILLFAFFYAVSPLLPASF
jgi:sortase A